MGDAMLGLVHPCKIYNMLAVGAPVIYIGPQPSHVTEILDRLDGQYPWCAARHGQAEVLAEQIQKLRQKQVLRQCPEVISKTFAKGVLLPQMITGLEKAG